MTETSHLRDLTLQTFGPLWIVACLGCDGDAAEDACTPDTTLQSSKAEAIEVTESHHRVDSFIVIDAPAKDVWGVLTDFATMPNWSTSFQGLAGDVQNGGEVVATYILPNPATGEVGPVEFPHTLRYEEGALFGWSDPIAGAPGITDNHVFRVETISDCQARFVQTDEFQGLDPAFTTTALAELSAQGYNAFNAELKAEVEKRLAP